jgi:ABC-2 type transport system ATP-binding protein
VAPEIEVRALSRRFGEVAAVDVVSFTVERREVFGLLGPNGAGKTTVVRMLVTLLPPTGGTALVAGHDVRGDPWGVRRSIGYVPQMLSTDGTLTGRENLLLAARLYDVPGPQQARRVKQALEFVELGDAGDRLVRTYSGGMVRRLEIAQAVIHRPQVLFLDEPTVGLDPVARRSVWKLLLNLRLEAAMTILVTTHYMEEAEEYCERVAIMHLGHIAAIDSPERLKAMTGKAGATLEDAFVHFAGLSPDEEDQGGFQDVSRTRRAARRLG